MMKKGQLRKGQLTIAARIGKSSGRWTREEHLKFLSGKYARVTAKDSNSTGETGKKLKNILEREQARKSDLMVKNTSIVFKKNAISIRCSLSMLRWTYLF